MISPKMVVDDLIWREVTGPGTTCKQFANNDHIRSVKSIILYPHIYLSEIR